MLFQPSSVQGKKLRQYVDLGVYELAVYDGRETLEIANQDVWSSIECGMTIFMNIALIRSSYVDWRKCPVCHTNNYCRDNTGKFALDWYVLILLIDANVSTYLLIAGIAIGGCKVTKVLLTLTAHRWSTKEILNLFVTSVYTKV